MNEPRTYTYTSPAGQVVVVTKVPTMVIRGIDGDVIGELHSAQVARVINKEIRAALTATEPDEVTHLKWQDLTPPTTEPGGEG